MYNLVGMYAWIPDIYEDTCHFQNMYLCVRACTLFFIGGFLCAVTRDALHYDKPFV